MSYASSIDALLSASPTGNYLSALSSFDSTPGPSVYNTNLWGGGGYTVNFTCVSWQPGLTNPGAARSVAITPRHLLISEHGSDAVGFDLPFIARDGSLVTGHTSDAETFVGPASPAGDGTDSFRVLYLSSSLPATITPCPIMGDSAIALGTPCIKFDKEGKALIANVLSYGAFTSLYQPGESIRAQYYEDVVGGDSGSPRFFLAGRQVIYSGGLTTSGSLGGSGQSTHAFIAEILAACAALDARNAQTGYLPIVYHSLSGTSRCSIGLALGI